MTEFSEVRTELRCVPLCLWWDGLSRPREAEEEGGKAVYARVSIFEGSPDQMDEALRQVREVVLPQAKQDEGFKGLIALGDRQSGKTLGITLWESEEAMRASEEDANRLRSESAEAGGQQIAGVERYEVGLFEVES
jgi:hypothetical protein